MSRGNSFLLDEFAIQRAFNLPVLSPYSRNPKIKKVIFNDPATIVIWSDDTKTVVKCQPGDTYSEELGLAMCISKKFLGNKGNFNEVFKKWLPEEKPIEPYVGTCDSCKYDYKHVNEEPCLHCNHNDGYKNNYEEA